MSVHDISKIDSSAQAPQNDRDGGAVVDVPMRGQRDIRTVTAEIRTLTMAAQRMVLEYAIEIGRRLHEAKEMLAHGEWGPWLRDEVSFSQSTANNFMRIFDEYGADQITLDGAVAKSQALGNLSYTKALKLLALPEEEREEFVETHDVESMSSRELEKAIKDRDAAQKELMGAKANNDILQDRLTKAKEAEKKARDALAELKKNPQIPMEVLAKLKAEAEAAAKQAADLELDRKTAALELERKHAEERAAAAARDAEQARAEKEAVRKELALASPDMAVFKVRFEAAQQAIAAMLESWERVRDRDAATAEKLTAAVDQVLQFTHNKLHGQAGDL